ncbi:MAG: hypothetical protein MUF54_17205 [Polyangiaceae bacterium]|nr:hypothetical protein [Polyangiaceae bacterium]
MAAGVQLGLPLGVSRWLLVSAAAAPALLVCALGFRQRAVGGFDRFGSGGWGRLRRRDSGLRLVPPRTVASGVVLVSGAASPAA